MAAHKCPHCTVTFSAAWKDGDFIRDINGWWSIVYDTCSHCGKLVVFWAYRGERGGDVESLEPVRPRGQTRPLSPHVPGEYRAAFDEAVATRVVSAAASAALSRRLLQRTLHEQAGVRERNLDQEIQKVIDSGKLSDDLAEDLDAVRTTGNFAAHPIKSQSTGEIVDVEPGEADWLLDVMEELFDHYFVGPAERKKKREAMNAKLQDAGKPELKTVDPT